MIIFVYQLEVNLENMPLSLRHSKLLPFGESKNLDWHGNFSPDEPAVNEFIGWAKTNCKPGERFVGYWPDMMRSLRFISKGMYNLEYIEARRFSFRLPEESEGVQLIYSNRAPVHPKSDIYIIEKNQLQRLLIDRKCDYFLISDRVKWCSQFYVTIREQPLLNPLGMD